MDYSKMKRAQLIEEIGALQERIAELEHAEAERKRAEEEIKQRSREVSALNAIPATVNQSLDLEEVLNEALDKVLDTMELGVGAIRLLDEHGGTLDLKAHRGVDLSPQIVEKISRAKVTDSPLAEAIAAGEPLIIEDISAHPIVELIGREDLKSLAVIPLKSKGRVLGTMEVASLDPRQFTSEEVRLLTSIGHQISVAVEKAWLYGDLERQLEQLSALADLSRAISSSLDLHEVLKAAVECTAQLTKAKIATIRLIDGDYLNVGAAVGYRDPAAREHPIKIDRRLAQIVEGGQPLLLPNLEADRNLPLSRRERMQRERVRAYLGVPMMAKGQPLGILSVYREEPHQWTQEEIGLASTIANQAAIAIENARLYEAAQQELAERKRAQEALRKAHDELEIRVLERTAELAKANEALQSEITERKWAEEEIRQRTAQLEALRQVGLELTAELDLDSLLHSIVSQAVGLVRGAGGGIYFYRPDLDALVWVTAVGPYLVPIGSILRRGEGLSGRVWETSEPLIVDDYQQWEGQAAICEGYPSKAVVGVPVRWGEKFLGVLNVLADPPHTFSPADGELLGLFATQAAIAIRNACFFEEIEERRLYVEGVLGAAPDAIVTLDAHHRVVEWNAGAERLFGYSREEVIGQNIDDLVTNSDVFEEAVGFTQRVMDGEEVLPTETVRYRKDGSPVDVIVAASPILVEDELIGAVVVYTDITTRVRMEEALRAMLLIDELTGLYNRRGFVTLGRQQLKTADRAKRRMVLLFADFDNLKWINDTFGHLEGDKALIGVADVLEETFRESDILARIGGDEFVVLAIETDGAPAEILATRLQENLEARNAEGDLRYKLSLSMGLAHYDFERPCSIDELLARADRSMYEQKQDNQRS